MLQSDMVAKALLDISAIGFTLEKPIRFKSGVLSPVYVDNRKLPFFPKQWKKIIKAFASLIDQENLSFDVIAGIETAGIPHSSALGFLLGKPTVFIRKQVKDHGTKKMVEGGEVKDKKVLLIEDHISTGGSSLHGVRILKNEGAKITACLAITSYGWKEAVELFKKQHVPLYTLTSFSLILTEARKRDMVDEKGIGIIRSWLKDPKSWEKTYDSHG